ncbi:hypothetical protein AMECASPLE_030068 [Ameca splendens]|uniref:Uncharacterized protein n=1 Tax=Ameca splendens TaxID=208324 RepID=A0ABV0ZR71_9TELE
MALLTPLNVNCHASDGRKEPQQRREMESGAGGRISGLCLIFNSRLTSGAGLILVLDWIIRYYLNFV